MPRDKLLGLAEEAVRATEQCESDPKNAFARAWIKNDENFSAIKSQYERMLQSIPEDRSFDWRVRIGIDDASLAALQSDAGKETPTKDVEMTDAH